MHLSSALIITEIDYILEYKNKPEALKEEHRRMVEAMEGLTILHPRGFFSWVHNNCINLTGKSEGPSQELRNLMNISRECVRVSTLDYTSNQLCIDVPMRDEIMLYYKTKVEIEDIFELVGNSRFFDFRYTWGRYKCYTSGNLHLINLGNGSAYLVTHAHMAGIKDMLSSLFNTYLYSQVAESKYPNYDLYQEVKKIDDLVKESSSMDPEGIYNLLKSWSSITISCIIRDTEGDKSFNDTLKEGLRQYSGLPLYQHLMRPIEDKEGVHLRLELSGLCKVFGHPIVYVRESARDWATKGSELKLGLEHMGKRLSNMFKVEFCRNYYREMGHWPNLRMGPETPSYIRESKNSNRWEENHLSPWTPEDFDDVFFDKTFEYDMFIDATDLLSDKSIIQDKASWGHEYDRKAYRTIHGKFLRLNPTPVKSAILSYLTSEYVSVQEIIETIETGHIPDSWKIIVGVPKEREFKSKNARFYCKLTPQMRLYQTSSENNIAKTIFPYVKNQSMTMTEEQLRRRLIDISRPKITDDDSKYIAIIVDFSAWCTSFRAELANPVFKMLDDLFGLKGVYTYTHHFPIESTLIFQDRYDPPIADNHGNPSFGEMCIIGPEAWMEGQRQKGWTLITILMLLLVARERNTQVSLLGQGDNQMVIVRVPSEQELSNRRTTKREYIQQFKEAMSRMADSCGLIIKPEESWHSERLIEYSKSYHYQGSQVSNTLKKISRIHSEANQTIPTFNGKISGMFSAGAAAAGEDYVPYWAYYVTCVEEAHHIRRHMSYLYKRPLENSICLLLIGRILGGLPIVNYSNFCTRAVQDNLTSTLHLVRTMLGEPNLCKHVLSVLCIKRQRRPDFETLVKDPQSLPLDLPMQPENYLKDKIKSGLSTYIKNRDVLPLFSLDSGDKKDQLLDDLSRITPTNPRLLNKIYSCSSLGIQEKVIAKFSNTRSIQRIATQTWVDEDSLTRQITMMEDVITDYYKNKAEVSFSMVSSYDVIFLEYLRLIEIKGCTTQLAQALRESMWGRHIEGITMPAQQEQTKIFDWNNIPEEHWPNTILMSMDDPIETRYMERGPHNPYFGSTTHQRARKAPLQVLEVGSIVSSIRTLLELSGWIRGNDELQKLLTTCIKEKTEIPIDILKKYSRQVYSGTISHRLTCPSMQRGGMSNSNLTFHSWIKIVSDTATNFAKKGENYNICFQSVFLHGIQILNHIQHRDIYSNPRSWGITFTCKGCLWKIGEEDFTLDKSIYTGLELENKIKDLRPKAQPKRISHLRRSKEGSLAYSVMTSRKVVCWIRDNVTMPSLYLDQRRKEEVVTASFLNLAELRHLDVNVFIEFYVIYHYLYIPSTRQNKRLITDPILSSSGAKTPHDVLIDTLSRSDNLQYLDGSYDSNMSTSQDLRVALYRSVSKVINREDKTFVENHNILTPEDSELCTCL